MNEPLQRQHAQGNAPRSTTTRNRLFDLEDSVSSPRGEGLSQTSPSGLEGRYLRTDTEGGGRGFYSQRNRPAPVRQFAHDEDTSSAYSTYGIPIQRGRLVANDRTSRLLEEQDRLEKELLELKDRNISPNNYSTSYSEGGRPKSQAQSRSTKRLLDEQKRLEKELKELKKKSVSANHHSPSYSTGDYYDSPATSRNNLKTKRSAHQNVSPRFQNAPYPSLQGGLHSDFSPRYSNTAHSPLKRGMLSDDSADIEVANLLDAETLRSQPSPRGHYNQCRVALPTETPVTNDEGYEELSVDYPVDYLQYPPPNQPIRILLSASSPEHDSIFSRLRTSEDVLCYYHELRARESYLKEQIRIYRKTLEEILHDSKRQDVEQKYFETQRELNTMEKELVKLFTFLSPDMLQLLRNSESTQRVLSSNGHVPFSNNRGGMGKHVDQSNTFTAGHLPNGFVGSHSEQPNSYNGQMTNHMPYPTNSNMGSQSNMNVGNMPGHVNYFTDNGLMGSQYDSLNMFGGNMTEYVPQSTGNNLIYSQSDHYQRPQSSNQNAGNLPVNHRSGNDPRMTSYPISNNDIGINGDNGMFGMTGMHGMNGIQDMSRTGNVPEQDDSRVYNTDMNRMHDMRGMQDAMINRAPIFQAHHFDGTNHAEDLRHMSPELNNSPSTILHSDKQTQTLSDEKPNDRIALQKLHNAKRDNAVTKEEQSNYLESQPHDTIALQEQRDARRDDGVTKDNSENTDHAKRFTDGEQLCDRPALQVKRDATRDTSVTQNEEPKSVNDVTPPRRPVPLPRERTGSTPKKVSPSDIDEIEMKKVRKLPQPVPRNKEVSQC